MTNTILKLIDAGVIRSINIHQCKPLYVDYVAGKGINVNDKYEATIRWEWATDHLMMFNTLEELDKKLLEPLAEYTKRFLHLADLASTMQTEG